MSGKIIDNPKPAPHRCGTPSREVSVAIYLTGTVWRCDDCGQTWEWSGSVVDGWVVETDVSCRRREAQGMTEAMVSAALRMAGSPRGVMMPVEVTEG